MSEPVKAYRYVSVVRLWLGNTASGVATWALPFLLGFAVSAGVISSAYLGLLLAVRTVGFLIAVPISGVLADRLGSRPIILKASMIAAAGAIFVMLNLGDDSAAGKILLILGMVLSGAGQGGCRPVYQSIVPKVVAKDGLQSANAAFSLSVRGTNLVGPAVAILIATALGLKAAFSAIVLLWLLSAFLPPWPAESRHVETVSDDRHRRIIPQLGRDLLEGIREVQRHPWFIAGLFALTAVIAAGYSVTNVLLPLVSNLSYDGPDLLAGATMALLAGALFGAVVLSRWRPTMRGWWALGGLGIYGVVPLSLMVPQSYSIVIAAYFVAGFGIELFNITWFTAVQQEIAPEKLARVSSLDFLVSYGLAPVGLSVVAPLSERAGIDMVLLAASFVCCAATLIASTVPSASHFRTKSPELAPARSEHG